MMKLSALESAKKFNWASVSGRLEPERVNHLDKYVCGQRILDVGCAGGGYVEYLSEKGLSVVGVEKEDELLAASDMESRRGTYLQGSIEALPLPDKSFDCTYCFDVLEHVDDTAAIRELARVTRSRLILTVPKEDEVMPQFRLTFYHYQDKTHLRNYTEDSLRELVMKIPFSHVNIFPELEVPMNPMVRLMLKGPDSPSFYRNTRHRLLTRLLEFAAYRTIHTGLVAVVDL